MSILDFFKPRKRGIIYIEAVGGGLVNKGVEYKGNYEVEILEETDRMYKVKFVDLPVYENHWVEKEKITIIKS